MVQATGLKRRRIRQHSAHKKNFPTLLFQGLAGFIYALIMR
jgi:hypothetical protein